MESSESKGAIPTQEYSAQSSEMSNQGMGLHRKLKHRQISMIAIGGAIGTGLIIGTGSALAKAGPASIFIAYSIVGIIVYLVMCGLGEMATWLPIQSGFTGYAARFVDPALGFGTGYTYWLKYCIVAPNQLTAAALTIQYWVPREKVNPGVFIAILLVTIVLINYLGIKYFGELEFWLSSLKILTLCGLIVLSVILVLGGGPSHDRIGFRYWKNPGAFTELYGTGSKGRFLAVCSAFITATLAYLGCEIVGVTAGEAKDPRRSIPQAIKLTLWRIVAFYVLLVLLVGMLVPYNSKNLAFANKASTSASASPFVVAMIGSGIRALPGLINGCILIFVVSAANSDMYISTRTLYALAREGDAPEFFARTNRRGVPVYCLALSAAFACIAFMNIAEDSKVVFGYLVNVVTVFGLLVWISILISHICFVRGRRAQGIQKDKMAYTAPLGAAGSYLALILCIIITIFKNYDVFVHSLARETAPIFDYKDFISGYIGIPVYLTLVLGYKFLKKTKRVKPIEMDLYTGGEAVDLVEQGSHVRDYPGDPSDGKTRLPLWLYRRFLAWLF